MLRLELNREVGEGAVRRRVIPGLQSFHTLTHLIQSFSDSLSLTTANPASLA